jgi:hypothetical protein
MFLRLVAGNASLIRVFLSIAAEGVITLLRFGVRLLIVHYIRDNLLLGSFSVLICMETHK